MSAGSAAGQLPRGTALIPALSAFLGPWRPQVLAGSRARACTFQSPPSGEEDQGSRSGLSATPSLLASSGVLQPRLP